MKTLENQDDRNKLFQRIQQLKPNSQKRWGKMSSHQMICHLNDSFKIVMGEKQSKSVSTFITRHLVKWIALYTPIPWPHGIKTIPELDQESDGTKPIEFEQDLHELKILIERFSNPNRNFAWHPHPIFEIMTDQEYFRWGYLHVDHHLRQFNI